jgi:hypothetical protein
MDRVNEVIYSAGLPGVLRVILWVKVSTCSGDSLFLLIIRDCYEITLTYKK